MAGEDRSLEATFQCHFCKRREAPPGSVALVDMQVEGEAVALGGVEQALKAGVEVRRHIGVAAEQAAICAHQLDQRHEQRVVQHAVDGDEADGLKLDAAAPFLAQPGEHFPCGRGARAFRIQMGADGDGAVGIGAAQGEVEAPIDVVLAPIGGAVGIHRRHRALEGAVRVRRALPDEALVEMGVDVDEAGQDEPAGEVVPGRIRQRAGRCDAVDPPVGDGDVERHQPFGVDRAGDGRQEGRRRAHAAEHIGGGELSEIQHHAGPPSSLSCQRRSTNQESRLSAA